MSPAAVRKPAAALDVPAEVGVALDPAETVVVAAAPFVIPERYVVPPLTRAVDPSRMLRACDIARAVRDEIAANVSADGDPMVVELAVRVIALANCVEAIAEVNV